MQGSMPPDAQNNVDATVYTTPQKNVQKTSFSY